MTAVHLFDTLSATDAPNQRAALAEKLVSSALSDLDRLTDYERLGAGESQAFDASLHDLYQQWADDADELDRRAHILVVAGVSIPGHDRLKDAIGRTRARLALKPLELSTSLEQARQGQFIPTRELRDELRARLRA
jgi:hypothetical protein